MPKELPAGARKNTMFSGVTWQYRLLIDSVKQENLVRTKWIYGILVLVAIGVAAWMQFVAGVNYFDYVQQTPALYAIIGGAAGGVAGLVQGVIGHPGRPGRKVTAVLFALLTTLNGIVIGAAHGVAISAVSVGVLFITAAAIVLRVLVGLFRHLLNSEPPAPDPSDSEYTEKIDPMDLVFGFSNDKPPPGKIDIMDLIIGPPARSPIDMAFGRRRKR